MATFVHSSWARRQLTSSRRIRLFRSRQVTESTEQPICISLQMTQTSVLSPARLACLAVTLHYSGVAILAAFQATRVTDADLSGRGDSHVIATNVIVWLLLACRAFILRLFVIIWRVWNVCTLVYKYREDGDKDTNHVSSCRNNSENILLAAGVSMFTRMMDFVSNYLRSLLHSLQQVRPLNRATLSVGLLSLWLHICLPVSCRRCWHEPQTRVEGQLIYTFFITGKAFCV
jgi:hypothetical protein